MQKYWVYLILGLTELIASVIIIIWLPLQDPVSRSFTSNYIFLFFCFLNYFFAGTAVVVGGMFYPEWAYPNSLLVCTVTALGATSIFAIWMSLLEFPSWIPAVLTGFVFSVAVVCDHNYARWKSQTVENYFQLTQKVSGTINIFFFLGTKNQSHKRKFCEDQCQCYHRISNTISTVSRLYWRFNGNTDIDLSLNLQYNLVVIESIWLSFSLCLHIYGVHHQGDATSSYICFHCYCARNANDNVQIDTQQSHTCHCLLSLLRSWMSIVRDRKD
jgi:hypothetical protein